MAMTPIYEEKIRGSVEAFIRKICIPIGLFCGISAIPLIILIAVTARPLGLDPFKAVLEALVWIVPIVVFFSLVFFALFMGSAPMARIRAFQTHFEIGEGIFYIFRTSIPAEKIKGIRRVEFGDESESECACLGWRNYFYTDRNDALAIVTESERFLIECVNPSEVARVLRHAYRLEDSDLKEFDLLEMEISGEITVNPPDSVLQNDNDEIIYEFINNDRAAKITLMIILILMPLIIYIIPGITFPDSASRISIIDLANWLISAGFIDAIFFAILSGEVQSRLRVYSDRIELAQGLFYRSRHKIPLESIFNIEAVGISKWQVAEIHLGSGESSLHDLTMIRPLRTKKVIAIMNLGGYGYVINAPDVDAAVRTLRELLGLKEPDA